MDRFAVGYVARVTESESGWGSRNDGWVLGWDKSVIDAWLKVNTTTISGDAREYSFIDGPFRLVKLTPRGEEVIESYKNDLKAKPDGRPFVWLFTNIDEFVEE
jgi:hypothetical protein